MMVSRSLDGGQVVLDDRTAEGLGLQTGLVVSVLRQVDFPDCTNGGATGQHGKVLLLGVPRGNYTVADAERAGWPVFKVVERWGGTERRYLHAEPVDRPKSGNVGWMAGGNFLYCTDSRFREVSPYPLSAHDRQETQAEYDILSR